MVNLLHSGHTHCRMRVPTFTGLGGSLWPMRKFEIVLINHLWGLLDRFEHPNAFRKRRTQLATEIFSKWHYPGVLLTTHLRVLPPKNKRPPYALRLRLGHSSIRIDGKCFIFNSNKYEITALLHLSLIMPISVFFVSFRQFLSFMQFLPECLYSGKVVLFTFW